MRTKTPRAAAPAHSIMFPFTIMLSLAMAALLALPCAPGALAAEAADAGEGLAVQAADDIASGNYRGVSWRITSDGELIFGEEGQTQTSEWIGQEEEGYPWLDHSSDITTARFAGEVVWRGSIARLFYCCEKLASVDLSGLDASKVTDMREMFSWCGSLASADLSGLDASGVTDMGCMFYECGSLESVNLSELDTSKVTNMNCMFEGCSSLASVDLSGLDTSGVTDMGWMFYGCSSLASLDLTGLDTSNVTSMRGMFMECGSLASVDLSGLDTSKVESMRGMFWGCESLASLDLSGFDSSGVTDTYGMFNDCPKLATITATGSIDAEESTDMFKGCTSLVGGNGTKYSEAHVDGEYARIDGEGGLPGYFTAKGAAPEPADPEPDMDPAPTSIDGMAVALSATSLPYNGKAQVPAVKTVGGKALVAGTDYDVSYSNAASKDAGTYTLTVTGKGGYAGTATASYKIVQAKNSAKAAKAKVSKAFKAKALKKKAQTVKLPKVTTAFGKAKWTVAKKDKKKVLKLKGNKVIVKKGAKKGTYTIKLKAKVAKTKNWKAASTKAVTVKVKVK